jgi:hypothetical protein
VRREIEHALANKKTIIPVICDNFNFDSIKNSLPEKLRSLPRACYALQVMCRPIEDG